jgi:ribosomal protein S18 acetylase RimI-like enzyme
MMTQTLIRTAAPSENVACLETLTRAFEADPVCTWVWPDRDTYRRAFPRFSQAFGGAAFAAGTAHADEACTAVALWLPPSLSPDDQTMIQLTHETVPPDRLDAMFAIFEQMGAYHPHEEHWHLPLIGVDPSLQGRGLGSALLQHAMAQFDKEGVLAYLEATSPMNMRLYQRHGFEAIGRVQAGDSPVITPMVRKPR